MKTMTLDEFQAACKAQAASLLDTVVVCPMCKALQCGHDFVAAGLTEEKTHGVMGFSCIGRYTGAGSPRKQPDGKPCNWTLGGLFRTHVLEVVTPDGQRHPHFELASNEAAEQYRKQRAALAQEGAK